MNRQDLQKAVVQAQQKLQEMELKALNAERVAKVAKGKAQQLKLEHRRAKKAAKQAKRMAGALAEQANDQCRVLEKAERRLAKALRKLSPSRRALLMQPIAPPVRRPRPVALAKPPLVKRTPVSIGSRRSPGNGHAILPRPHTRENTRVSQGVLGGVS